MFETPGSRPRRFLTFLPVVLLVLVAVHQIILSRTDHLSPWKGGGFGMFSTTDGGASRHLRAWIETPSGATEVFPPPALRDAVSRVRELPAVTALERLARELAEHHANTAPEISSVRLELWRTTYDPESLTPRLQLLREIVTEIEVDE